MLIMPKLDPPLNFYLHGTWIRTYISNDPFCIGTSNFSDIAKGGYSEPVLSDTCYPFYCVIRHWSFPLDHFLCVFHSVSTVQISQTFFVSLWNAGINVDLQRAVVRGSRCRGEGPGAGRCHWGWRPSAGRWGSVASDGKALCRSQWGAVEPEPGSPECGGTPVINSCN